jgi:hypothetical protein
MLILSEGMEREPIAAETAAVADPRMLGEDPEPLNPPAAPPDDDWDKDEAADIGMEPW